jgi:heme O synthase-like polyprenyltransferase
MADPTPDLDTRPSYLSKNTMRNVLALLTTIGFFGVIIYILTYAVPVEGREVLLVLIGSLATTWTGIIGYHFGSSQGSDAKTALLAKRS